MARIKGKETRALDLDDDPRAERAAKAMAKPKRPRKGDSRGLEASLAAEDIQRAQTSAKSLKDKIPVKRRGFVVREPVTGELFEVESSKAYQPPASVQQNYPVDIPAQPDEQLWLKFFPLVTFYGGNVTRACKELKISRLEVTTRQNQDPAFRVKLKQAREEGVEILEDEVIRRAVEGVEKPVGFYKGVSTETETVYSDSLLMFALKAAKPDKYAERSRNENLNVNAELDREEMENARRMMFNKLAGGQDEEDTPIPGEVVTMDAEIEVQPSLPPPLEPEPEVPERPQTSATMWGDDDE